MPNSAVGLLKVGLIGGETHVTELTRLGGTRLRIIGAAVRDDQRQTALAKFKCPVYDDHRTLLAERPSLVAIANENDRRTAPILDALDAGCDLIVDKPLCIDDAEQDRIEAKLRATGRRLLLLLTLRGSPPCVALREVVMSGRLGEVAFVHVRMSVQLKRAKRPPWFLDSARSGGLFLDLLIHGLDQVEWITSRRIVRVAAATGNLGRPQEPAIRDHASVYCLLDNGATAVVEGQRMLPDTIGSDYRIHVAGTRGFADMDLDAARVTVTDSTDAGIAVHPLPPGTPIVTDFLDGGSLVPQAASLRANRLALAATRSARMQQIIDLS